MVRLLDRVKAASAAALIASMATPGIGQAGDLAAPIRIELPATTSPEVVKSVSKLSGKQPSKAGLAPWTMVYSGNPGDIVSDVRTGKVQFGLIPTATLTSVQPGFKVYDSLFVFDNLKEVDAFQRSKDGQDLLTQLGTTGLEGLSYVHDGLVQLASKKPIQKGVDLSGLSLSIDASNDSFTARQFEALGTNVKSASTRDAITDVLSGRSDATEITWTDALRNLEGFKQSGQKIVPTSHRYRGYVVVANPDFLNALSEDDRRQLVASVQQAVKKQNDSAERDELKGQSILPIGKELFAGAVSKDLDVRGKLSNIWSQSYYPTTSGPLPWPYAKLSVGSSAERAAFLSNAFSTSGGEWPHHSPVTLTPPSAAFWNGWFSENGHAVSALVGEHAYVATIDLSPYEYTSRSSSKASSTLNDAVDASLRKHEALDLRVRAFIMTEGVEFDVNVKRELVVPVRLDVLSRASSAAERAKEVAQLDRMRTQGRDLAAMSEAVSAGRADFQLISKKVTTCVQIAFSIWNNVGSMPLDHVVMTVPLRASEDVKAPTCKAPTVQGSFASLIGGFATPRPVDAALHLFQYAGPSGRPETFAIYVDVAKYKATSQDARLTERGIYSWKLSSDLAEYVATDLPPAVATARDNKDYGPVGTELRAKFFPYKASDQTVGGARSAAVSLKELKSQSGHRPTLLVRAVTADGKHLYAPLAMLAASKDAPRLSVVYPLPRENYSDSACVARWTVGLPKSLEGVNDEDLRVDESKTFYKARMSRLTDIAELKNYLDPPASKDAGSPLAGATSSGEALLLLAHQANGYLWFTGSGDDAERRIPLEANNRSFPPGSVAFLGACNAIAPKGGNQALVEKFNINGVDAVIASPFPVVADYGRLLVFEAIRVVRDDYDQHVPMTIGEIFTKATDDLAKTPEYDISSDRSLEFVLLGDPALRLCQPASK